MATEAILHQQRCQREPRVNVRWVRERIERPKGRSLKVLIYARFSKLGKRRITTTRRNTNFTEDDGGPENHRHGGFRHLPLGLGTFRRTSITARNRPSTCRNRKASLGYYSYGGSEPVVPATKSLAWIWFGWPWTEELASFALTTSLTRLMQTGMIASRRRRSIILGATDSRREGLSERTRKSLTLAQRLDC